MKSLGWQVEKAGPPDGGANVFIRHFPIFSRWSVIKIQRPDNINYKDLEMIAKRHRALFVKIEPVFQTTSLPDFRKDNWPLLPTRTLMLDLKKTNLESLPKDTRYEIRQAEKNQVKVELSQDVELFYRLLQETMKIGKWEVPIKKEVVNLWKSFQPNTSQLLIPYQGNKPVGGCLLIWDGDTAHYMYAALTRQGRANHAAYLTLLNAIEYLKRNNIKYLDLEGIYDDRFPTHTKNWKGFTKFKLGWGGKAAEYPGSWIKYYSFVAKLLFTLGEKV